MATYTSYLNLEKPTTSETFNLLKMNQNWDKIDAGVSALNSKITTTTARTTLESGWSVASSQNIIYKSGDVALLLLWVTGGTITQNAWNQIATIPSGYIPLINVDFVGINNGNDKAVHCQLTNDGRLLVYGSADAGTTMRFSATYFCG